MKPSPRRDTERLPEAQHLKRCFAAGEHLDPDRIINDAIRRKVDSIASAVELVPPRATRCGISSEIVRKITRNTIRKGHVARGTTHSRAPSRCGEKRDRLRLISSGSPQHHRVAERSVSEMPNLPGSRWFDASLLDRIIGAQVRYRDLPVRWEGRK